MFRRVCAVSSGDAGCTKACTAALPSFAQGCPRTHTSTTASTALPSCFATMSGRLWCLMAAIFHQRAAPSKSARSETCCVQHVQPRDVHVSVRVFRKRKRNLEKGRAYLQAGNRSAAHSCFTKAVEVTPQMCFELILVRRPHRLRSAALQLTCGAHTGTAALRRGLRGCPLRGGRAAGLSRTHRRGGAGNIGGLGHDPLRMSAGGWRAGAFRCDVGAVASPRKLRSPSRGLAQVMFKMDNGGNGDLLRWKHVLSSDGVESGGLDFVEWTADQVGHRALHHRRVCSDLGVTRCVSWYHDRCHSSCSCAF